MSKGARTTQVQDAQGATKCESTPNSRRSGLMGRMSVLRSVLAFQPIFMVIVLPAAKTRDPRVAKLYQSDAGAPRSHDPPGRWQYNGAVNSNEKLATAWQHQQAGQFSRAERLYQAVLSDEPEHPGALHLLGILMHQTGHTDAGAELIKCALHHRPDDPHMHSNLAMILEAGGKLQQAIEHNQKAIALAPDNAGARLNLANQLRVSGEIEAAIAQYRDLLARKPDEAAAWSNLGSALRACGQGAEAVAAFEKALAHYGDHAEIYSNLGNALQDEGRYAEAVEAFRKASLIDPNFTDAFVNLGIAHLQAGKAPEALEALRSSLQLEPDNRTALAIQTLALCQLGQDEAARALTDLDAGIVATKVETVRGFESVTRFNEALAQHVCQHPSIRYEPFSKTTRRGRQTGNLLQGNKGPIARLEQVINRAVEQYLADLPLAKEHPYRGREIQRWSLNIWATVLDEQGYQAPHIHPGGWLSGVYYVALPAGIGHDSHDGYIEFGSAPPDLTTIKPPPTRLIRPEEGTLLVFPSFFYHRTLPFTDSRPRISIAFDAIPTG